MVIAALGNLQIRIMARRQLHALRRDQIDERLVLRRQMLVHRGDDFLVALRAGDLEHLGVAVENLLRLCAQAARDDDLAVLGERLADRLQRLIHRGVDEPAGVDHHQIRRAVARGDLVALGPQARENALRIDERLRASQADEAHFGRLAFGGFQDESKPWRVLRRTPHMLSFQGRRSVTTRRIVLQKRRLLPITPLNGVLRTVKSCLAKP